tara:strand:- start:67 stop:225 length:159 start_codon:yes stop_codon:yes gene_type:complete
MRKLPKGNISDDALSHGERMALIAEINGLYDIIIYAQKRINKLRNKLPKEDR